MSAKHTTIEDIKRDILWPINLQLFAEGGEGGGEAGEGSGGEGGEAGAGTGGAGGRTLTQAEVDALIEKRLERERKAAEKRMTEAVEKARKDAEERARMTEEEKARADRERAEKAAKDAEEKLAARERDITRRERRAQAIDTLIEKDLPKDLEKLLDYSSEEACAESLKTVESVFRASVQAGVDARIAGGGRRLDGSGGGKQTPDYDKMSDAEYYASLKK